MEVVASQRAVEAIAQRGGRLYVWSRKSRCCGALTTLRTASEPPPGMEFERVDEARFELFVPARLRRPDELHIDARSRSRVDAYWNGCAWMY